MLDAIAGAREAFDSSDNRPLWVLDAAGTRTALSEIAGLVSQVAELEARLLAHAGTVEAYADQGHTPRPGSPQRSSSTR